MSCTYDKERLTAFFDGELDAAERADTERHISGCSECLRDLGEIKAAATAVKSLPRPRAPRSIAEGVSREIAGAGRMRRLDVWRRRLFVGVAAAAALLIALNLAYFTTSPASKETASTRLPEAPVIGLVGSDKAAPKDGKEDLAKASTNAHAAEEKAANRQDAKGEREAAERRAVDALREKGAPVAESPAPAAARKAEAKQDLQAGAAPAPKPAAPTSPPPAPKMELAKKAADPGADEKLKELQDEPLKGRLEQADARRRALAAAPAYVVTGAKAVEARARVEAIVKTWDLAKTAAAKAPEAAPAPDAKPAAVSGGGAGFGRAVEPLVLEVTPARLEELRAELAKAGWVLDAETGEGLARGAAKDGLAAAPGEERKRAEADKDRAAEAAPRKVTLYFVEKPAK